MGRLLAAVALGAVAAWGAACRPADPPRRYVLQGQVLGVHPDRGQITIRHADIPNYMPAMTMSFEVASKTLLDGRVPGDLVTATLEVKDGLGRLTEIVQTGSAALPADAQTSIAVMRLDAGDVVPDAAFLDQADARRSLAEWRGTVTLVTFIYTRCPLPTYCPLMDQNFATLQRHISEDPALRGRVKLVSISFDPEHDTPAVLAAHAAKLRADPAVWTFLTGDRVTIERTAARFGVGVLRGDTAADEITHNLRTALVDARGRIVRFYTGSDWTPSRAIADLRSLVR
jgi:protein SCO1/2